MHYLTKREVALRFRMSERTLDRYRENGTGPAVTRIGRHILFSTAAVNAWQSSLPRT